MKINSNDLFGNYNIAILMIHYDIDYYYNIIVCKALQDTLLEDKMKISTYS